jgi:hypothetical protein
MNTVNDTYFLVSGMARSGTTLVDKILDSHDNIRAFSQPIPKLYRHVKSAFFKSIGDNDTYYVLNNLFNNDNYTREQFLDFLENYNISNDVLKAVFKDMEGWSGQSTNFDINEIIKKHKSSKLIDFYKFFIQELNEYEGINSFGTKEILIEEFVEYFLNNGVKVILIIRDPRDIFTSLNVGVGTDYAGKHRPTLFHLRNWRKSAAIANTFNDHDNCLVLKYEDLVQNYESKISEITTFLNLDKFPTGFFDKGIRGKNNSTWKGNSSTNTHKGIDSSNKNKFQKYLSEQTIAYIEYICKPEMLSFNYELYSKYCNPYNYSEPFEIGECGLNINMSTSTQELKIEDRRVKVLEGEKASKEELVHLFYSAINFEKLRNTLL